jgi:hypothetical protein
MQHLGKADNLAAVKTKTPEQFTILMVHSMSVAARQQITQFLGAPPGAAKPAPPRPEKLVLVLAYYENNSPIHPRINRSREVQQFRVRRRALQPGTVQIVLVLSRENA